MATLLLGWLVADRWPLRNRASADSNKIVSIYAGGQTKVITTTSSTVRAALNEAGITTAPGDDVEPGLETKIPNGSFNINVYPALPYRIVDGNKVTFVRSAQSSPQLIAADAHVKVYPQDNVRVEAVNNFANDGTVGQNIIISRAPAAKVQVDGKTLELRSRGKTVADLLKDNQISLGNADTTSPALTTPMHNGLTIVVRRVRVNVETTEAKIDRPIQQTTDANQPKSYRAVKSEGADGKQRISYVITYNDGKVVEKKQIKSEVIVQPQPRIEVVGSKVRYSQDSIELGYEMAVARGWGGAQWDALYSLWMRESGWNADSVNNGSGACGIPQAYPCSKIRDKSAAGQIKWGLDYIAGKFGNPQAAWAYWLRYGSY